MRSRQTAVLAQSIGQTAPGFHRDGIGRPVDAKGYADLVSHAARFPLIWSRMRCGDAGISKISIPNGDSASTTALMTLAGAPMRPPSPTPFAFVIDASDV